MYRSKCARQDATTLCAGVHPKGLDISLCFSCTVGRPSSLVYRACAIIEQNNAGLRASKLVGYIPPNPRQGAGVVEFGVQEHGVRRASVLVSNLIWSLSISVYA